MSEKRIGEALVDVLEVNRIVPLFTIWFDGACEPRNPGGVATCGWIIKDSKGDQVAFGKREIARGPAATNNVAEYSALGLALRYILDNHERFMPCALRIQGDSKLVVEQLNGTWQCKAAHLQRLRDRCLAILNELGAAWSANWIPREQNHDADALSQQAYEDATGMAFPKRGSR